MTVFLLVLLVVLAVVVLALVLLRKQRAGRVLLSQPSARRPRSGSKP